MNCTATRSELSQVSEELHVKENGDGEERRSTLLLLLLKLGPSKAALSTGQIRGVLVPFCGASSSWWRIDAISYNFLKFSILT